MSFWVGKDSKEKGMLAQLADSKPVILPGKQVEAKAGLPRSMPRMLLAH